jgi:hypothetical protein
MKKKIKSRDEWNDANGYKVPFVSTCATCRYFTPAVCFDHNVEGICEAMFDDGVSINFTVAVTAICNRFKHIL